jgi:hypothetical protein
MSRKKNRIKPELPETNMTERRLALTLLKDSARFDPATYLYDDAFRPGDPSDFRSVHTMAELMECLERDPKVEAEGVFLEANSDGVYRYRRINSAKKIRETFKANAKLRKIRECKKHVDAAMKEDGFLSDGYGGGTPNAGLTGDDFVPLLGGPFNKQPYLYDYLRAHAYCFHEYHHHPFAKAIIHITRDFVLGRGYTVDSDDQGALALWRAFEETNRLPEMMEDIVKEGSLYGENLIWWLPNNAVNIAYQVKPGQAPAQGLIPRIRLIDPSTCWEIVTMPEDIRRVLYYQLIFPTQYQIFTGKLAGQSVPTSKFIMQQLPAEDVMHFKYNCVSNEKRGRSDLFPVLGYLKWLRDCVNYKLISLKKQAAWTEDIVVEGSQADVDQLAASLNSLGPFEPAGSRFIHTNKITRNYMANQNSGGAGDDPTMNWGVDMVAVGSQIPASYFGLLKSGGQTKASALVGTEPVAKKFERRQEEIRRIIKALWRRFQDRYGVPRSECEVSFPEIISQDSSQALKDIKFGEDCGYWSRETAAPLAAKEVAIDNYDYPTEQKAIAAQQQKPLSPTLVSPLTAPAASGGAAPAAQAGPAAPKPSGVTGQQRVAQRKADTTL